MLLRSSLFQHTLILLSLTMAIMNAPLAQTSGQQNGDLFHSEIRPELWGSVLDGPTGVAISGVMVRVGDNIVFTDEDGFFGLVVPQGEFVLEVQATLPDGRNESMRQLGLRGDQLNGEERTIYLVTSAFLDDQTMLEHPMGLPLTINRSQPPQGPPVDLLDLWWSRRGEEAPSRYDLEHLVLPDLIPTHIRVGRCYPDCCYGGPAPRIDSVDLDTYAAGVVNAEIGVFRALTTGEEGQVEGFKTFAIAARSYALWFWASDPDADYHLDDTACNQRYMDGPYPESIVNAAQATSGMILVQNGTEATVDKFEYAASCGRHGSLPEYATETVPDLTGGNSCTSGGWCGHNNCAAHEVNPDFPDEGRCLVRGICQWGTSERSARGDNYIDILDHYQPNLMIHSDGDTPATRLLGFVRSGSIDTGPNIAGAIAALDTGQRFTTAEDGLFTFDDVQPGHRVLTVLAEGFNPLELDVELLAEIDNWNSVALIPSNEPAADENDLEDQGEGGQDASILPDLTTDSVPDEAGGGELGTDPDGTNDYRVNDDGTNDDDNDTRLLPRFAVVGPDGLSGGCSLVGTERPGRQLWNLAIWLLLLGLFRQTSRKNEHSPDCRDHLRLEQPGKERSPQHRAI